MSIHTNISWCDSTVNPTTGCDGCELWDGRKVRKCYAGNWHEKRLARSMPQLYDADFKNVRLAPGRMMQAANWPDLTGKPRPDKPHLDGLPRLIFVGDMGDFGSKKVPTKYIVEEIIGAIKSPAGRRHFWLLLTKQIRRLADISIAIGGLPDNCMAMTTVTTQHAAKVRMPQLLRVECKYRGVSAEPLLGRIDMTPWSRIAWQCSFCQGYFAGGYRRTCTSCGKQDGWSGSHKFNPKNRQIGPGFDWLITGGESGEDYREVDLDDARFLHEQCAAAGVPFFYKQGSAFLPGADDRLDGARIKEMPAIKVAA